MWEFVKSLLASRGFWTGLGPVIIAIFNLVGHPLGDDQQQALGVVLTALAGWLGKTAYRRAKSVPGGYRTLYVAAEKKIEDAKYGC